MYFINTELYSLLLYFKLERPTNLRMTKINHYGFEIHSFKTKE